MSDLRKLRVYLDANVLFSASRDERSPFHNFWRMSAVTAITSQYAIGEVLRNIESDSHRQAFEALTARTEIVRDADPLCIPAGVQLVFKDQPILAAAILAKVDYLITGDKAHFGHLYGNSVAGVEVIRPADFLTAQAYRLIP